MRKGRRLAVDVGTVRIGLALCDSDGILASPIEAISRTSALNALEAIAELAAQSDVIEIYVGDPLSLSGLETISTADARGFAKALSTVAKAPVRLIDERLTTVSAAAKLRQNGSDAKGSKALIDSASAVEILEQALRTEKASGAAPGLNVEDLLV
jgi:putative Holliday junction resolvase